MFRFVDALVNVSGIHLPISKNVLLCVHDPPLIEPSFTSNLIGLF